MKRRSIYLCCFIILVITSLCGCAKMTDEEYTEYQKSKTHEYSVASVYQYMDVETNNFGGVISQDLKYAFTYIGDDGQLHQFDDFEHTEYGLWKVCVGDENKYVVVDGLDTYRYLYLTEDTLKNMETK